MKHLKGAVDHQNMGEVPGRVRGDQENRMDKLPALLLQCLQAALNVHFFLYLIRNLIFLSH